MLILNERIVIFWTPKWTRFRNTKTLRRCADVNSLAWFLAHNHFIGFIIDLDNYFFMTLHSKHDLLLIFWFPGTITFWILPRFAEGLSLRFLHIAFKIILTGRQAGTDQLSFYYIITFTYIFFIRFLGFGEFIVIFCKYIFAWIRVFLRIQAPHYESYEQIFYGMNKNVLRIAEDVCLSLEINVFSGLAVCRLSVHSSWQLELIGMTCALTL